MIGFDVSDAAEFVKKCLQNGLLVNSTSEKRIRLVPPLILTEKEVDEAIEVMTKIL